MYIYKDEKIKTKNAYIFLNYDLKPISNINFMINNLDDLSSKDTNIVGLEDVRLFYDNNKIYYTATISDYSYNDKIRILKGEYNYENKKFINNICMIPPSETNCEKNWVIIKDKIIYNWHPLQIGILKNNKLEIIQTIDTPNFFKNYKGSTNAFEYNNEFWFVTHGIIKCSPTQYFHQIVILDKDYKLVKYSIPFYFQKLAIEYCLGFIIINEILYFIVSRNDSNPIIVEIKFNNFNKYFI